MIAKRPGHALNRVDYLVLAAATAVALASGPLVLGAACAASSCDSRRVVEASVLQVAPAFVSEVQCQRVTIMFGGQWTCNATDRQGQRCQTALTWSEDRQSLTVAGGQAPADNLECDAHGPVR